MTSDNLLVHLPVKRWVAGHMMTKIPSILKFFVLWGFNTLKSDLGIVRIWLENLRDTAKMAAVTEVVGTQLFQCMFHSENLYLDQVLMAYCRDWFPIELVPLCVLLQAYFLLTSFQGWLAKGRPYWGSATDWQLLSMMSHMHEESWKAWLCLNASQAQGHISQLCIAKELSMCHIPKFTTTGSKLAGKDDRIQHHLLPSQERQDKSYIWKEYGFSKTGESRETFMVE